VTCTESEPSQNAVDLLDLALGRVDMARGCLDELRQPQTALVSTQTLIERAESCLDDVVGALRSARVRVADLEPPRR
jgi:hypothetical protein